ncbi:DUF3558 family protein [Pseudonocardia sp. CA-107938]|uniref:DUF3558 family protein n=1 Tax=Pseudonocardia sp. CA-107938 TaxID=3240021 RepID=UPI003D937190
MRRMLVIVMAAVVAGCAGPAPEAPPPPLPPVRSVVSADPCLLLTTEQQRIVGLTRNGQSAAVAAGEPGRVCAFERPDGAGRVTVEVVRGTVVVIPTGTVVVMQDVSGFPGQHYRNPRADVCVVEVEPVAGQIVRVRVPGDDDDCSVGTRVAGLAIDTLRAAR